MNQVSKAELFAQLHIKGKPVVLYNAWDAGSAKVIQEAGAKAIATSSWAVAAAQGYEDGECIPLETVKNVVSRIIATTELPVSLDFEGGYSEDNEVLKANISDIINLGIVGINFEDRVVKGEGLYDIHRQAQRISAIRKTAQEMQMPLFINARTDVFFGPKGDLEQLALETIERGKRYAEAGASGLFVPGLTDAKIIGRIVEAVSLPINVMILDELPSIDQLSKIGVARISHGDAPYIAAANFIAKDAAEVFGKDNHTYC
jgi:2-methylisocitrate lyase-like PEP mutase family enzyme